MTIANLAIKNRIGRNLFGVYEGPEKPRRLVFLVPGLGGDFNEPHLKIAREVLLGEGFGVLSFDPFNTGKSGGKYSDITVSGYLSDLEDVIGWARTQTWFAEPFWLIGHSLGGITVGTYAEKHPEQVAGLIMLSSVISGKLSCETEVYKDKVEEWQRNGWTINDVGERLPWRHMADRLNYDLVTHADSLAMPTLLVVGSEDKNTPPDHQVLLFSAIRAECKELEVIIGADHVFDGKLDDFRARLSEGIETACRK